MTWIASPRLPAENEVSRLSDIFKALADGSRLKIVFALMQSELCVGDICQAVEMNQSAVSHQLRVLRGASLVKYRRGGKQIFYSIDDDHVSGILQLMLDHARHSKGGSDDEPIA